jgi:hypothetical protein
MFLQPRWWIIESPFLRKKLFPHRKDRRWLLFGFGNQVSMTNRRKQARPSPLQHLCLSWKCVLDWFNQELLPEGLLAQESSRRSIRGYCELYTGKSTCHLDSRSRQHESNQVNRNSRRQLQSKGLYLLQLDLIQHDMRVLAIHQSLCPLVQ